MYIEERGEGVIARCHNRSPIYAVDECWQYARLFVLPILASLRVKEGGRYNCCSSQRYCNLLALWLKAHDRSPQRPVASELLDCVPRADREVIRLADKHLRRERHRRRAVSLLEYPLVPS